MQQAAQRSPAAPQAHLELARLAVALLPNLKVIFTTGYTRNAIIHSGRLDPDVVLVAKPYTPEILAKRVRAVLRDTEN